MLTWARERARIDPGALLRRFPKLQEWEDGAAQPTLKQLEAFARATHAPVGQLFLNEPPVETLPIPDFRTIGNAEIARPSPDLLDMIYVLPTAPGVVSGLRTLSWRASSAIRRFCASRG